MSGSGGASQGFSDFGAAAGDLFSAMGDFAAVPEYKQAEYLATENAGIEQSATNIKLAQQQRSFEKTVGSEQAEVAGNGFGASGSALDLLRSSTQQGALAHATVTAQGQINENSYKAQSAAYSAEAVAANAAGNAAIASGFFNILGGVASFL